MSALHVLQSIFEIALVVFVVWAVFHEDTLIKFEKRIASALRRRRLKVVKQAPLRYAQNDARC